ncbi:hypothetical protein [Maridesulfovibrio hydrothermalis]|uniref:hypothetical protein n=1 Tax=Maridesulfovibrio hydrothermalis TaxID=191026 RepID=UPI0004895148|nr:hypothetical protein [Maridesulfovibrio hydrothermalis]
MILIHDENVKVSRDVVEQYGEQAESVIVWNDASPEAALKKEAYFKKWDPHPAQLPSVFPSVTHPTLPVVCSVVDDPATDLQAAVVAFYNTHFAEYGSAGYGTTWAELVASEAISIEKAREAVTTAIKAEAQHRILSLWAVTTVEDSIVRQMNQQRADNVAGTTDERFTKTDAIRTASNNFEAALADMDKEALAALVVREWDGWPITNNE